MPTTTSSTNTVASPQPLRRRSRWVVWTGRILLGLLALIVLLAASGATYEAIMRAGDAKRYPPPGQLVDVGGHRLHVYCVGQGSPTVVLDAGLGAFSLDWGVSPDRHDHPRLRVRPGRPRLERTWPAAAEPGAVCRRAAHAADKCWCRRSVRVRGAFHLRQDGATLREPAPGRCCGDGAHRRAARVGGRPLNA